MEYRTIGILFVTLLASVSDAEVRKWTDASGKYSLQAEFVEFREGNVQLRQADGRLVTIPLEKLSAADQEFVKQQAAQAAVGRAKPDGAADATTGPWKAVWTMDPSKMNVPQSKVSGKIHGEDFLMDAAEFNGRTLTLRQGKDFFPDLAIEVSLSRSLQEDETLEGKRFNVTPKDGFRSPSVSLQWRTKKGAGLPETEFVMGKYAMTLQFGKQADGKVSGKIYASLLDKFKSVVAGTFSITAADAGIAVGGQISGKITVRGTYKGLYVSVGCVGRNPEGKLEDPNVGFELGTGTTSATNPNYKPRNTTLSWDEETAGLTHKHVNRPPGHYLVYVRTGTVGGPSPRFPRYEGYADWKCVEIKDEKAKVAVDLTIDPGNVGTVEVTARGATKESSVTYLPLDDAGQLSLADAHRHVGMTSSARLEGGKAVIRGLREGKYQIALGPWRPDTNEPVAKADVEVKRGATTKVELVPPSRTFTYTFTDRKAVLKDFDLQGGWDVVSGELVLTGTPRSKATSKATFSFPISIEYQMYMLPDRPYDLFPGFAGIRLDYANAANSNTFVELAGKWHEVPHEKAIPNRVYRIVISVDQERTLVIGIDGKEIFRQQLDERVPLTGPVFLGDLAGHVACKKIVVRTNPSTEPK
jgi:hypothetical protein